MQVCNVSADNIQLETLFIFTFCCFQLKGEISWPASQNLPYIGKNISTTSSTPNY